MQTALITGASSGIGAATARALARLGGWQLILCGRRAERLAALAQELSPHTLCHGLAFDVANLPTATAALASLPEGFTQIDLLVNNAGNAHGLAPIHKGDVADWDAMIDSNIRGVLHLTRLLAPQMVARRSGQIVNLGSVAGHEVYPNGAVYCGTKYALKAISEGMRRDLAQHNIRVVSIDPGLVESEFSLVRFKGDAERAKTVYAGYTPLSPADVAEAIVFAVTRPAHVVVADMVLLPIAQAGATQVHKVG